MHLGRLLMERRFLLRVGRASPRPHHQTGLSSETGGGVVRAPACRARTKAPLAGPTCQAASAQGDARSEWGGGAQRRPGCGSRARHGPGHRDGGRRTCGQHSAGMSVRAARGVKTKMAPPGPPSGKRKKPNGNKRRRSAKAGTRHISHGEGTAVRGTTAVRGSETLTRSTPLVSTLNAIRENAGGRSRSIPHAPPPEPHTLSARQCVCVRCR